MDELVTVIMPSFNTGKFIKQSIDSVLGQTYKNLELIIVDDCSTDNTEEVVSQFSDERIRFYKNNENQGAAFCRNEAISKARGKWIAFLDSDDLWNNDKLEKQIAFMKNNNYHFSYTKYEEIDENSNPIFKIVSGPKKISKHHMYRYCWPGCLTVMYDKEYVGVVQVANIKKNNDYAMWLKICKKCDCFLLEENLGKYRRGRVGSISSKKYSELIKWHYRLFRLSEKENVLRATWHTFWNMIWGFWKKKKYVSKGEKQYGCTNVGRHNESE